MRTLEDRTGPCINDLVVMMPTSISVLYFLLHREVEHYSRINDPQGIPPEGFASRETDLLARGEGAGWHGANTLIDNRQ